jgi:hypothetical protein
MRWFNLIGFAIICLVAYNFILPEDILNIKLAFIGLVDIIALFIGVIGLFSIIGNFGGIGLGYEK